MDDAAVDKLVKKTYGRAWPPWLYACAGSFVFALLSFIVLCALLGTPFSYEVDALLFTISYEGWLDTKPYMWAVWMPWASRRIWPSILPKERGGCGASCAYIRGTATRELCLRGPAPRRGLWQREAHIQAFDMRRSLYFSLENGFVHLLCTYLRARGRGVGIHGKRLAQAQRLPLPRHIVCGRLCRGRIRRRRAAREGGGSPRGQAEARQLWCTGYAERAARGIRPRPLNWPAGGADSTDAGLVEYTYFTARCYERMGDTDMAAVRYGYAAENGGTMRCAQKAREWLAARESAQ